MSDLSDFLASHPYADETIRTYTGILERLESQTDPATLTAAGLVNFLKSQQWGASRRQVGLAACQKYIRWKYGDQHPALTARMKRERGKPQRALTADQAIILLASFDTYTAKGARDLALCALALDTGLRASELCRLKMTDIDLEHGALQVIVKGGQWEAAVFSPETAAYLERWYAYRPTVPGPGFVFISIRTKRGLTATGLTNIVGAWGDKIGLKLSPHDLRRSFAVLATQAGAPERVLMAGGRWHNSEMIKRYTRTLKLETMRPYLPVPEFLKKKI